MSYSIEIDSLAKSFNGNEVLGGLSLKVEKGTMLALLGPNGAGKTTCVRILSTLLKPDSGDALVNGFSVTKEPNLVRQSIGLTGQYAAVDEYLTGRENLVLFGKLYHLSAKDSRDRAEQLLQEFDLVKAADRAAKTYSGGMKRRLDLALSLIATPPVIFLDEPTTGLDPRSRLAMWEIIKKLVAADVTILLTTQYLEEADQLADKIAVLDGGRIIAQGTADELKSRVGKERLELVIQTEAGFKQAVRLLHTDELQVDEKRRSLSFAVNEGVKGVKRVLDQMANENIEVEALSLHKPTLDDVFLKLTGHAAEQKSEGEEN